MARRWSSVFGWACALELALVLVGCQHGEPAWLLDERSSYALRLESSYGPEHKSPLFDLGLLATLHVTPIKIAGVHMDLLLTLSDVVLNAQQADTEPRVSQAQVARVTQGLQKPYLCSFDNGRFVSSRLANEGETDPMVITVLRTVSAALQRVPGPKGGAGKSWQAIETDATGSYKVAYERLSPSVVHKHKLRYDTWNTSMRSPMPLLNGLPLPRIERSQMTLTGEGAAPDRLLLDEAVAIEISPNNALRGVTTLQLTLRSRQLEPKSERERSELYARTNVLRLDAPLPAVAPSTLDRVKRAGLSLADIVKGLEAQAKPVAATQTDPRQSPVLVSAQHYSDQRWMGEQSRLFAALNATLRQDPSALSELERLIRADSPAADVLISALGASATADGHALLLELMDDPAIPEARRKAAGLSLLRTPHVSAAAVSGVEAKLDDPNWQRLAIYGLGTYARLLREAGEAAQAERLWQVLESHMRAATSIQSKVDLLLGLSNSGSPRLVSLVRAGLLSDRNSDLRRAAVLSLRLVSSQEVDTLLLDTLSSDGDRHVRLAVLQALRKRPMNDAIAAVLARIAVNDASERVRHESVRLLARSAASARSAQVRAALQQVAKGDRNEVIRQAAAGALTGAVPPVEAAEEPSE